MDTRFLRTIDKFVGRLLTSCMPPLSSHNVNKVSRVLFIRPGGLGDALLLLPVIEALINEYPDAEVDILGESRNRAAYAFLKGSHSVEVYTDPGAFFRLRKKRYDVIIDSEQWYRLSTVYARLLKPRRLIGFSTNDRARMLTDKVGYSLNDFELESFFHLLEPLGIFVNQSEQRSQMVLSQEIVEHAKHLLDNSTGVRWVAIFPGASLPEKCWPIENYFELIKQLQKRKFHVAIVGGETERQIGVNLAAETKCTNLAGKTSLAETGGILVNTELLITGDSAVLHLAASLGVSTVSLFGPSSPEKWSPQGPHHKFLQKQFECVPCSRYGHIPPCPHNVKCLNTLAPDGVLDVALSLLDY